MTKHLTLISSLFVLTTGGIAAAENPSPTDAGKAVYEMVGKWSGTGQMTMDGHSADLKLSMACAKVAGGFGVSCRSRFTGIPGLDSYEEQDLFGYDAEAGVYHWFSVTNAGEVHDHKADVASGKVITFVHDGSQGGKPFKETITLTCVDKNVLAFSASTTVAGKVTSTFEGKVEK